MSRKVFLLALLLTFSTRYLTAQAPTTIYITPLKCLQQSQIIISEKDMSGMLFAELTEISDMEVQVLSENSPPPLTPLSDFLITGEYRIEGEIFTVNYQIESAGGQNRHPNSVTGLGLPATQNVLKTQISGLFSAVNFLSIPKDADLKIAGFAAGKTPASFPRFLAGKYLVQLQKPGFTELSREIDVTGDQTFTFELLPRPESSSTTQIDATIKAAPANIAAPMIGKLAAFEKKLQGKITIYVLGAPEVAAEFKKGVGKSIGRMTIEKVEEGSDLPVSKPTILFIGDATKVLQVLQYTEQQKVLSAAGDPVLVQAGVSLGVGIGADGKPKILLNVTTSAKENLEWNPAIFEIAQIIK